jgi:hypothetical protein
MLPQGSHGRGGGRTDQQQPVRAGRADRVANSLAKRFGDEGIY